MTTAEGVQAHKSTGTLVDTTTPEEAAKGLHSVTQTMPKGKHFGHATFSLQAEAEMKNLISPEEANGLVNKHAKIVDSSITATKFVDDSANYKPRPKPLPIKLTRPSITEAEIAIAVDSLSPEQRESLKTKVEAFVAKKEEARKPETFAERMARIRATNSLATASYIPVIKDETATIRKQVSKELGKLTLAQRIALQKQDQTVAEDNQNSNTDIATVPLEEVNSNQQVEDVPVPEDKNESFALDIVLNDKQQLVKDYMFAGKSIVVTGAAGTGKTTVQRAGAEALLQSDILTTTEFKIQGTKDYVSAPSIAFVAYTRRASGNLRRAIHKLPELEEKLRSNIMTIHALLEYQPVPFFNEETMKDSMRFEPMRHAENPLTITHLVIEEASMVGLDLWEKLFDALPHGVQIVFIGDINQLPPVFGPSIMNYALTDLPVVELTEVYRQLGDSPVLANAHRILKGEMVEEDENENGSFKIIAGNSPVQVGQSKMALRMSALFSQFYDKEFYDPEQDIILAPWNKQELGTTLLNYRIAQFIGDSREAVVHEIIAGYAKVYLAVGDKVIVNKLDGTIKAINFNGNYAGKQPQLAGSDLSRFGFRKLGAGKNDDLDDILLDYSSFSVEEMMNQEGERKQQASHAVTCILETGEEVTLNSAGDFNPAAFQLGYALTTHKAQGCEWRKVFIIMHKDHNISTHREWFYTAVTRARQDCLVIAKHNIIEECIKRQHIKGNTLADKIAFFNAGIMRDPSIKVTK